ncbi:hypothetical protein KSF_052030 [Reticulibacter mediterranei]|uniref:DUF5667 domain-containing protein n=1 Tax=Reticulibacter mediterranei TaxID=2778369 RepID=A0A8J3N4B4_9CHLR|nr:hypothetical protein [Reticulibacter mediterranei]GHO95155.1 hypothetical protein KSF_052030 [Reticulibacter mediterranei]
MNSFPDRLNDRLERQRQNKQPLSSRSIPQSKPTNDHDSDVDELAMLAQRLQEAPQLQVDSDFARRLEARILAHHATLSKKQSAAYPRNRLFQRTYRMPLALSIALICLLLAITLGTLTVAAQASNSGNPLYEVKQWMQGIENPHTSTEQAQAEANWSKARDQLKTLTQLADPAHAATYRQALADLDQQINKFAQSIQALPTGPDKDNLSNKLTTLKADARQTLHDILPRLRLSEKLLTTDELGRLHATIPEVDSAVMVVSHSQKQATITITGEHFQSSALLLVDNQIVESSAIMKNQDGSMVFTVDWSGKQPPQTIGILNPDGTAAQTNTLTFSVTGDNVNNTSDKNNNGNHNANNNGADNNGNSANKENTNNNGADNNNGKGKAKGKGKGNATATPTTAP